MKKIEVVINASMLNDVRNALDEIGIEEMTLNEVKAFGRQKAHAEVHRGIRFPVAFVPEIKIELTLPDSELNAAIVAILKGTKAANINDRRIFVSQIEEAICNQMNELAAHAA